MGRLTADWAKDVIYGTGYLSLSKRLMLKWNSIRKVTADALESPREECRRQLDFVNECLGGHKKCREVEREERVAMRHQEF